MRNTKKNIGALFKTIVIVMVFRALVITIYTVPNGDLQPRLFIGDRVMVNRWAYGLRTGDGTLFRYARLLRQPINRGELVAFNIPQENSHRFINLPVCIGYISAIPGDKLKYNNKIYKIPHCNIVCPCEKNEYYAITSIDKSKEILVPESHIIGKVILVVYNELGLKFSKDRFLLPIKQY